MRRNLPAEQDEEKRIKRDIDLHWLVSKTVRKNLNEIFILR